MQNSSKKSNKMLKVAKDISDFYKAYGRDKTIELIKEGIIYLKQWEKNS